MQVGWLNWIIWVTPGPASSRATGTRPVGCDPLFEHLVMSKFRAKKFEWTDEKKTNTLHQTWANNSTLTQNSLITHLLHILTIKRVLRTPFAG